MGLLDTVLGALKGATANSTTPATPVAGNGGNLLESVIGLITDQQSGGLNGLINQIAEGGLADQVASWVSTGQNLPVTAEQIQAVLGSSVVQGLAQKVGIDSTQVAGTLATLLPQVINQLTPEGQVPAENKLLELGIAGLTSLLNTKTA